MTDNHFTDEQKIFFSLLSVPSLGGERVIFDNGKRVLLSEILFAEVNQDNYVSMYLVGKKKLTMRTSLKRIMEQLPQKHFVIIHRSRLINTHYVTGFTAKTVEMANGTVLEVSRGNMEKLNKALHG